LRFDPDKNIWSFDKTPIDGLDDFEKGRLAFHRGDFSQAASLLRRDIDVQGESEARLFWLALSYMRLAETRTCLPALRKAGVTAPPSHGLVGQSICALPIAASHADASYSKEAAQLFQRLLDKYDRSNDLYRWLLNLNYMTIQSFPQGVPQEYLIQSDFI